MLLNLKLMAEVPLVIKVPWGKEAISGNMDYVVAYGSPKGQKLDSVMVVIEAKRPSTFPHDEAQCLAYMGKHLQLSLTTKFA